MKHTLLLLLGLLSLNLFSQNIVITNEEGENINNQTVEIEFDNTLSLHEFVFNIQNTGNTSIELTVTRVTCDLPETATSNFCIGDGCFPPHVTTTTLNIAGNSTMPNNRSDYVTNGKAGNATVKYEFSYSGGETVFVELHYTINDKSGINDIEAAKTFNIYPNPTNDKVFFDCDVEEESVIEIYNLVGQKIKTQNITSGISTTVISVSDLSSGAYFCTLSNSKGIQQTKRLIVQ